MITAVAVEIKRKANKTGNEAPGSGHRNTGIKIAESRASGSREPDFGMALKTKTAPVYTGNGLYPLYNNTTFKTLCRFFTSFYISQSITFIDQSTLLGTYLNDASTKISQYSIISVPWSGNITKYIIRFIFMPYFRRHGGRFNIYFPDNPTLFHRSDWLCLARFILFTSSSEKPCLANAASLARCRSSSNLFLATPDL